MSAISRPASDGPELEAVILAGGLGTRLRGVLDDRPKVLAPIADKPFLDHLLLALANAGVRRALLCLGHLADMVVKHLQNNPPPLPVNWVVEPRPLGTGGALRLARPKIGNRHALVMNGDTWIGFDLTSLRQRLWEADSLGALVYAEVADISRYGRLELDADDYVAAFSEKDPSKTGPGIINGGVYLFTPALLDKLAESNAASLERDFLERLPPRSLAAFRARGSFIDIGTPQSLAAAPAIIGGNAFGRVA